MRSRSAYIAGGVAAVVVIASLALMLLLVGSLLPYDDWRPGKARDAPSLAVRAPSPERSAGAQRGPVAVDRPGPAAAAPGERRGGAGPPNQATIPVSDRVPAGRAPQPPAADVPPSRDAPSGGEPTQGPATPPPPPPEAQPASPAPAPLPPPAERRPCLTDQLPPVLAETTRHVTERVSQLLHGAPPPGA